MIVNKINIYSPKNFIVSSLNEMKATKKLLQGCKREISSFIINDNNNFVKYAIDYLTTLFIIKKKRELLEGLDPSTLRLKV